MNRAPAASESAMRAAERLRISRGLRPDSEASFRLDERRLIARDLHDGTSQLLTVIQLTLGRLKAETGDDATPLIEECQKVITEIRAQIRGFGRA
jgi:signal transduction histidine kinase